MQKESLGLYIKERMISNYEHFTNPEYSDNPDVEALEGTLEINAICEVLSAVKEFQLEVKKLREGKTNAN